MEFLCNYDITEYVKKCHDDLGYGESLAKYYVCEDVWDFHVYRVIVGYNAEYDRDDSAKLIEQNDISKEDVKAEFEDLLGEAFNVSDVRNFPNECLGNEKRYKALFEAIVNLDDGENYDVREFLYNASIEELIEEVDAGYGITVLDEDLDIVGEVKK